MWWRIDFKCPAEEKGIRCIEGRHCFAEGNDLAEVQAVWKKSFGRRMDYTFIRAEVVNFIPTIGRIPYSKYKNS